MLHAEPVHKNKFYSFLLLTYLPTLACLLACVDFSQEMIGHTVFAVTFARVFELIFWLGSFKELSNVAGSHIPGYIVLVSQVAHLLMMGDFFYYYFKSITRGTPMELPPVYSNVV